MTSEKKAVPGIVRLSSSVGAPSLGAPCLSSSVGAPPLGAPEIDKGPPPCQFSWIISSQEAAPDTCDHRTSGRRAATQGWVLWLSDPAGSWGHVCICEMGREHRTTDGEDLMGSRSGIRTGLLLSQPTGALCLTAASRCPASSWPRMRLSVFYGAEIEAQEVIQAAPPLLVLDAFPFTPTSQ